jgi:hypothetical protein
VPGQTPDPDALPVSPLRRLLGWRPLGRLLRKIGTIVDLSGRKQTEAELLRAKVAVVVADHANAALAGTDIRTN